MYNNIIKKIKITGFRTFEKIEINTDNYNIFSGTNDVGKSNILKALNLFFNNKTDFMNEFSFQSDYNLFLKEKATKQKIKQLIKIRLYFNPPSTFKSLLGLKEVFIEKQYDRNGFITLKYCNDNKNIKNALTKLLNKIQYIYIPALKGEDVIRYLLALIGNQELINPRTIAELNQTINNKTKNLINYLKETNLDMNMTFEIPNLLFDFWSNLNVRTENEVNKKNNYFIDLKFRGDGIKNKVIPPILEWLEENNKNKIFIWGIDEPENSLEFNKADELSKLFINNYSKKRQIFITTHSLAFLNPENKNLNIFRVIKKENNLSSKIINISDTFLFENEKKEELLYDLGVLEVQREIMENYRNKIKELKHLKEELKEYTKPILLVEGQYDKKFIENVWIKIFPNKKIPFKVIPAGTYLNINNNEINGGANEVKKTLELVSNILNDKQIVIGLFDNDIEGIAQFNGLKQNIFDLIEDNKVKVKKHKIKKIYAILLPIPSNKKNFEKYFTIEHYFNDTALNKSGITNNEKEFIVSGYYDVYKFKKGAKKKLVKNMAKFDAEDVKDFKILFETLKIYFS